MARVKIDIPDKFSFSTKIEVRIGDINYGGHVGNDAILSVMHDARLRFFGNFGYSELELGTVSTIMADSAIVYKGEGFADDVFEIFVAATDFNKYGFDLIYKIINQDGKDIAHAKTGILCFNYEERKLTLLPSEVKKTLENAG